MNKVTRARISVNYVKFPLCALLLLWGCFTDIANAGINEWTNLGLEGVRINTLAIDPSNPAVVYVGAGSYVYKSTDSGATWQQMNIELGLSVHILAIDPLNPAIIYAGTNGTVYKSSDGAATWQALATDSHGYTALAVAPSNPAIVYAGGSIGVQKSTDGGITWQPVNNGLAPDCSNNIDCNVTELAIDPSNPTTIYAGTSVATSGSVFKSTDGAASWQAINNGLPNANIVSLAIDPNNPDTVYAGTAFSGAFKTTDGGINWQLINGLPTDTVVHALVINPNNPAIVYAGMALYGPDNEGVFKSTDDGATWQAVNTGLTNLNVSALAIDPGNPATVYAGTDGGGVFKITFSADTPQEIVPVVLIHGITGDPTSFGQMLSLLASDAGLVVAEPFDYSEFTQGPSAVPIEDLAGHFAAHIDTVFANHPGATQVDIVAHSMGGLITRAWIAGMSPLIGIPYVGQIRKLILIGTPNYGADTRILDDLCSFVFGGQGCSEVARQVEQMKFGSEFIWTLHNRWEEFKQSNIPKPELLWIAGTQGARNSGFECNDAQGCNDGIVDISSAVLPDSQPERIRYVPYRHADTDSFIVIDPSTFGPLHGPTIAGVTDEQHTTYRLVKEFLKNDKVLNQCCGIETVDYNPPHLRGIRRKQEGLFLVRLLDASTGQPVGQVPLRLRLSPRTNFDWQGNQEGNSVTAWGVNAPGVYDITIGGLLFYRAGTLQDVQINVARPTVPPPVELAPR